MSDHYKTLGISPSATEEEIKAAYRKLAKQYHPDINKSPNASAEFSKIQEAYEGLTSKKNSSSTSNRNQQYQSYNQSKYWYYDDWIDKEFEQVWRTLYERARAAQDRKAAANSDVRVTVQIPLDKTFEARKATVEVVRDGKKEIVEITVPAGVQNRQILNFKGLGNKSNASLPPGNLVVEVLVAADPRFSRQQDHLYGSINVDTITATVGGPIKFLDIHGKELTINIPPGAVEGRVLRISGHGFPAGNSKGDMMLVVKIVIPTLSSEQIELLKSIRDARTTKVDGWRE